MKVPLSVITGYLGAGKTTLLKNILQQTDKRIAVIMNEFGDIAVDAKIIKGKNVAIAELSGGCVCCSIIGEFEEAIKEVIKKVNPELIILETTGVADPENLVSDIQTVLSDVVFLDAVITIVDADALTRSPSIGHTGQMQIETADVILVNKADLVTQQQAYDVRDKLKALNRKAIYYKTRNCKVALSTILGFNTRRKSITGDHKHNPAESSFTYESTDKFSKAKFEIFLQSLPKGIFRAKGFVKLDGKSYLVQYVFGRYELEPFESAKNQLVFIGDGAEKIKNNVLKALEVCKA